MRLTPERLNRLINEINAVAESLNVNDSPFLDIMVRIELRELLFFVVYKLSDLSYSIDLEGGG